MTYKYNIYYILNLKSVFNDQNNSKSWSIEI